MLILEDTKGPAHKTCAQMRPLGLACNWGLSSLAAGSWPHPQPPLLLVALCGAIGRAIGHPSLLPLTPSSWFPIGQSEPAGGGGETERLAVSTSSLALPPASSLKGDQWGYQGPCATCVYHHPTPVPCSPLGYWGLQPGGSSCDEHLPPDGQCTS